MISKASKGMFLLFVTLSFSGSVFSQVHVDSAGNMGIGTLTPSEALSIFRVDTGARARMEVISNGAADAPQMIWRRAGNDGADNPTGLLTGDNLGAFSFRGHDGTNYTGSRGFISVQATENWSGAGNGLQMEFKVTQNGTTAPFAALLIQNDGSVVINGVGLNVPDYVFEEDYKLMKLDDLAEYLKVNKHLPGIASAKDVNTNGLNIGDTQLNLLEKVEELTLYTIEQHQQLKKMEILESAYKNLLTAYHDQQQQLEKLDQLEQMVNMLVESKEGRVINTSLK